MQRQDGGPDGHGSEVEREEVESLRQAHRDDLTGRDTLAGHPARSPVHAVPQRRVGQNLGSEPDGGRSGATAGTELYERGQ